MNKTKIMVSFGIIGDIEPNDVTSFLRIEPTKKVKEGEKRKNGMIANTSVWRYEIDYTETVELAHQLNTLIMYSGLNDRINELLFIQKDKSVYMRLDVAININKNEKPIIWIEPAISKFASELDINIDISTYFED